MIAIVNADVDCALRLDIEGAVSIIKPLTSCSMASVIQNAKDEPAHDEK